ncbi:MAG: FAD/NAD(P)-binding oxidoreductase [Candidatus Eremiobacterota bacterium]
MKRVVVVGGGTGGTLVANLLARKLKPSEAEITLISDSPRHLYQPGWLYVSFGWLDQRSLSRPLRSLLRKRVRLVLGRVSVLDPEARVLALEDGQRVPYDYLVLAPGAVVSPEDVPGLAEHGDHCFTEQASLKLWSRLQDFQGGRIVVGVGGLPHKCPVAPLEFTFLLEEFLTRQGVRPKTEIVYTYPIGRAFSIESVSDLATPLLEQRGVQVETFFNLEEVRPGKALSLEGTELDFDLLVMVPPHRGPAFLQGNPLAEPRGWLKTDRNTLQVLGSEDVWAIGDATDLPISKAGSTAHFQAPVVVEHLVARLRGQECHASYGGHVMCFLETGYNHASLLDFDYQRPPKPAAPNAIVHYQKMVFNKAYWYLVPTGVL